MSAIVRRSVVRYCDDAEHPNAADTAGHLDYVDETDAEEDLLQRL